MGPESYRHRGDGEARLSNEWYLDDMEVDHVKEMIQNGEITKDKTNALIDKLASMLSTISSRSGGNLSAAEKVKYTRINEVVNDLRRQRNNIAVSKTEAHHNYLDDDSLAN